ncbi:MAG: histidinol-phosphate transaminase, partial [Clostridiales bacterium]|nr:histidinol-phosphate transaminase [Clostridiales bacterium]
RKYIKLNTNENPYGPSPKVIEAIKAAADDSLKLYPDPTCSELVAAASEYYGVAPGQIFTGNGSDEVLAFAFMSFFDPDREILFADITYSFYPVYAGLFNLKYRLVPLDEGFGVKIGDYFNSIGGVILANPNAPTGRGLSLEEVRLVLENNPETVVILDEAYIDFGGETAIPLINEFRNLLVIRTFSKSHSLAGMRLGFAIGDIELIEALNNVKNSFNSYTLDRLAIKAGVEAFRDKPYFEETRNRIMATRSRVVRRMTEMGFSIPESTANFIFAAHSVKPGKELFSELRQKGILVRYFNKPRIDNHLRISIGSDTEMDSLLTAFEEILNLQ